MCAWEEVVSAMGNRDGGRLEGAGRERGGGQKIRVHIRLGFN